MTWESFSLRFWMPVWLARTRSIMSSLSSLVKHFARMGLSGIHQATKIAQTQVIEPKRIYRICHDFRTEELIWLMP